MATRVVRLGSPREADEGLRIGTVRRPPRGVKKEEYASRDFFDVWLPELAPSQELVTSVMSSAIPWKTFVTRYRKEMASPSAQHLLMLLVAMSQSANFSVGCYCEDESRCHRSVLRELLEEQGAVLRRE